MRYTLPGIFTDCILLSLTIYMTAMENSLLPMIIQLIQILLHVIYTFVMMIILKSGFLGISYATNCTRISTLILFWIYIKMRSYCIDDQDFRKLWRKLSKEVLNKMEAFVWLAFSGLLISCFEEISNEGLMLISGLLEVSD